MRLWKRQALKNETAWRNDSTRAILQDLLKEAKRREYVLGFPYGNVPPSCWNPKTQEWEIL